MDDNHQSERQSQPEHLVQNFYIVMPNAEKSAGLTENSQTENVLQAIRAALGGASTFDAMDRTRANARNSYS